VTGTPIPAWESPADGACTIKINVPSGNCSLVINQQKPGTPSVSFATTTFEGKRAIEMTSSIKGITYTVDGPNGSICGEPGTFTNGEYVGKAVLRGYKSSTTPLPNRSASSTNSPLQDQLQGRASCHRGPPLPTGGRRGRSLTVSGAFRYDPEIGMPAPGTRGKWGAL
jgi:hypothetical protein